MSIARGEFLINLTGIGEAIALEPLAYGTTGMSPTPGIFVLRRGILVAGLIALESFIRNRTSEVLHTLQKWPKSFEDLPEKLREAARFKALSHLQQYAALLKRQGEDYESEIESEIAKMGSGQGTVQQFTKFVSGDHTGNLSDGSIKDILSALQIQNCWVSFQKFAGNIGIGIPSVHELVKNIVRKRHRSAHSAGYYPTASDINELRSDLLCIAICFDVAISCSMEQSISSPDNWARGECNWRAGVNLYIAKPSGQSFRVVKFGRQKAMFAGLKLDDARKRIPRPSAGEVAALVVHDFAGRPIEWDIL